MYILMQSILKSKKVIVAHDSVDWNNIITFITFLAKLKIVTFKGIVVFYGGFIWRC